ncbi:YadA C-terminal domain-containing protein, partial [Enterobacter hormaechei]
GYWYYDRHRSVRLVILVGLAIDQIAQSGLSSLSVIYYSAQLFSAVAIASMPQVEKEQAVMFSAGVGSFKDEQAVSVGASFHVGSNTIVKAGVSDSTNNDLAMGAGIGIGF